jgi:hypothetical protein
VLLVLTALVVAACGVPLPGDPPPAPVEPSRSGPASDVDTLVPLDDGSAELTAQLLRIAARAAEVRETLEAVVRTAADTGDGAGDGAGAETRETLRALGDEAVGLLLGTPDGGGGAGVLPAVEPDRGGTATDDLITALITYAGDVGGERSRLVLELIRDPLLGDLGAWQRDPVGVIALMRAIADEYSDVGSAASMGAATSALDMAVLEIPGELTRSLGYAFVIAGTDDARLAAHAAERAIGHLGVVIIAIELAIERLGST